MKPDSKQSGPIEYHVVYSPEKQHWQVEYQGKSLGYPAWDKRVAISAGKELATKNRPSKVIVHDRKGPVQSEIPYHPRPQKVGKEK
jgi:Uncharacterized protein conserved in bacteria (DUF2188)